MDLKINTMNILTKETFEKQTGTKYPEGKSELYVKEYYDKYQKWLEQTVIKLLNLHGVSKSFVSGSKVEITGCFIGHEFEIGEIVTLIEESGEQWLAENSKGERWYIIPEETNAC